MFLNHVLSYFIYCMFYILYQSCKVNKTNMILNKHFISQNHTTILHYINILQVMLHIILIHYYNIINYFIFFTLEAFTHSLKEFGHPLYLTNSSLFEPFPLSLITFSIS